MKNLKKIWNTLNSHGFMSALNCLAVIAVINSVSSTCFWDFYQPEVPESARRLAEK
ncbi:cyclic lactone autoinducer peptide [Clostridium sp. AN503]|jgi:cyclic lactone autoinducer peptide|uniref:cyclic lactone autoinducer peptide n=1 Tax=Clostridium sp. AN503 TaxID=3160598 RepID=UPI003459C6E9